MALGRAKTRLGQLWQFPLLLFALGLFAYTGYLFIDPKGGPTVGQRLDLARAYLRAERFEAACGELNALLSSGKLSPTYEGAARMLLGEALEQGQRIRNISVRTNHEQIIRQTKSAIALGIAPDGRTHCRLAESFEAIGRLDDAVEHYRSAAKVDREHALKWQRKVIDLELSHDRSDAAAEAIDEFLASAGLAEGERAWAMGEKAHVLVDQGRFDEARQLLEGAMKLNADQPLEQGRCNYWLGYCLWKLGQLEEAERRLRVARDQLGLQQRLDADAAYALGRIRQAARDHAAANSFYAAVLENHLDYWRVALPARLGRGVCRIALGEQDAGLSDLQDVVKYLRERQSAPAKLREETLAALDAAMQLLVSSGNIQAALDLAGYQQELQPRPSAEFFGRLGRLYERRASQLETELANAKSSERAQGEQKIRECRARAGDAFVACAQGLVLKDDKGYGASLWRAIEMYDAAADLHRSMAALEEFVTQRPSDPLTPDAMFRLGNTYHAAGFLDKAITTYQQCQARYEKSLAASRCAVQLARAYMAKGPDCHSKAEEALRGLIENNPQVTPEAQEFREALWEVAQLYARTSRYEMAISRLEEMTQRYANDERIGQVLFLMADSYRKSATVLEERIKAANAGSTTRPVLDIADASRARVERLTHARDLYARLIGHYRAQPPVRDLDRLHLKLSYFYRADCVYDLGDYLEAIRLYGDAAFRYQDDPSALCAYAQMVTANAMLGRMEEAKAANERARVMLRRMPAGAFDATTFALPRGSWEQWLKWSSEAGLK